MNLNNQTRSGRPKTLGSEAMLQTIEANPVSSTQRVSGELGISQSSFGGTIYQPLRSGRIWHKVNF